MWYRQTIKTKEKCISHKCNSQNTKIYDKNRYHPDLTPNAGMELMSIVTPGLWTVHTEALVQKKKNLISVWFRNTYGNGPDQHWKEKIPYDLCCVHCHEKTTDMSHMIGIEYQLWAHFLCSVNTASESRLDQVLEIDWRLVPRISEVVSVLCCTGAFWAQL